MGKRTDIHRPSEIIPADYRYRLSFSNATVIDGWPVPPVNRDLALEIYLAPHPTVEGRKAGAQIHGGIFSCDVCGAHYIYGDLWEHVPTGEIISLGHDCAAKYSLIADRTDYDRTKAADWNRALREHHEAAAAERRAEFLADHPGLEEALEIEHYVSDDLKRQLRRSGRLTEPQVELAFKLKRDTADRQEQEEDEAENLVPVPTAVLDGRVEITGRVIAAMFRDSDYGPQEKMILAVDAGEGKFWKLWSTLPRAISDSLRDADGQFLPLSALKGETVRFTAKIEKSDRDECFAFAKRPTKAERCS